MQSTPPHRASLRILFGSQTGTAREVAERLQRSACRRRFDARALPLDACDPPTLLGCNAPEPPAPCTIIFIVATAGQGQAPDHMRAFWQYMLRKELGPSTLAHVRFCVFGLGDSSYPLFNAAARRLHQRLLELGAAPFHARGLGDDQDAHRYDTALEPWAAALWQRLDEMHPLPPHAPPLDLDALAPPAFVVQTHAADAADAPTPAPPAAWSYNDRVAASSSSSSSASAEPRLVRVLCNRRLTSPDHDQDVRHIEFDTSSPAQSASSSTSTLSPVRRFDSLVYEPGDVAVVYPSNPADATRDFVRALGLDPDAILTIASAVPTAVANTKITADAEASLSNHDPLPGAISAAAKNEAAAAATTSLFAAFDALAPAVAPSPFPSPVRVRDLFEHYLDVWGTPRRHFFETLAHFAADERHAEKLRELGSGAAVRDVGQSWNPHMSH